MSEISTDIQVRLNKFISEIAILSRRQADQAIAEGRVKINGKVAMMGQKVNQTLDMVQLDGKNLRISSKAPKVYWLLHKPSNYITSRVATEGMPCIFDLPKLSGLSFRINPIGRLDFKTEGLLLLTNDGELQHRLCHPSYKLPRDYQILVSEKLTSSQINQIKKGIMLSDGLAKANVIFAQTMNMGKSKGHCYFVTVHEGRNRLVRRIFESFGMKVNKLVRFGFGELRLPLDLPSGHYRQLNAKEIKYLKSSVQLGKESSKK
jgi:23S rRNA pseudouridine2605 synthase